MNDEIPLQLPTDLPPELDEEDSFNAPIDGLDEPLAEPPPAPPPTMDDESAEVDPQALAADAAAGIRAAGATNPGEMTEEEARVVYAKDIELARLQAEKEEAERKLEAQREAEGVSAEGQSGASPSAASQGDRILITLADGTELDITDAIGDPAKMAEILRSLPPLTDDERADVERYFAEGDAPEADSDPRLQPLQSTLVAALNKLHEDKFALKDDVTSLSQRFAYAVAMAGARSQSRQAAHRTHLHGRADARDETQAGGDVGAVTPTSQREASDNALAKLANQDASPSQSTRGDTPQSNKDARKDGDTVISRKETIVAANPFAKLLYNTGYTAVDSVRKVLEGAAGPWQERNAEKKVNESIQEMREIRQQLDEFKTADTARKDELLKDLSNRISLARSNALAAADCAAEIKDRAKGKHLLGQLQGEVGIASSAVANLTTSLTPEQKRSFGSLAEDLARKLAETFASLIERISARLGYASSPHFVDSAPATGAPRVATGASTSPGM